MYFIFTTHSFLSVENIPLYILTIIICLIPFATTDIKAIPLQLSHLVRPPSYAILGISPLTPIIGNAFSVQGMLS